MKFKAARSAHGSFAKITTIEGKRQALSASGAVLKQQREKFVPSSSRVGKPRPAK